MLFSRMGAACVLALLSSSAAMAAPEAYMVNLGPVARTEVTRLLAVGRGSGDVTLDGRTLTISANFSGLGSPATDAHLCTGIGIGTPGPCDSDLAVTKDTNGTVTGTVTLNTRQMAAIAAGRLYIQIDSQKAPAPNGNLWGWILVAHEIVGQDVPQQGHWFLPQYDMPKSVEHGSTHELRTNNNS
jgi:hypothetical protein